MGRLLRIAGVVAVILAILGVVATRFSPWPMVIVIRQIFDRGAAAASAALVAHLPAGVEERPDLTYDPDDPDGRLDLFLPPGDVPDDGWPVVVWVHGGAWVSGRKEDVGNYLRILSARGFATVAVDYTLAPTARHPGPTRQVNRALGWLRASGEQLGLDMTRVALAGDSAGAQIAAQAGIVETDPAYAGRLGLQAALPAGHLRGLVLFCGGFDATAIDTDGAFGGFLRTVMWAYLGQRDFAAAPDIGLFSIPQNLPPGMPPLFVSAGSADPLAPQSTALADRAAALGIVTDTLFFAPDHQPPLGHEYQFNLDTAAGQEALDRATAFLARLFAP